MPDNKLTDVTDNNVGKMNDNEIIKALECCARPLPHCYCDECPAGANGGCAMKTENIIDLINRLQAENERLKAEIEESKAINESIKFDKKFLGEEIEKYHKELLKSKVFKFIRNPNRIYNIMDFQDGEILMFYDYPEKPSALAKGYLLFKGKEDIRLINISEVKELSCDEVKAEAYKECIEKVKEKAQKYEWVSSGAHLRTEYTIGEKTLDNILKELVGEDNA